MLVVNRFEEMQAKKASPTKPSSSETKPASQPNNKEPVPSTSRQAATKTIYDVSTDDDDDDAGNQLDEDGLPVLPDFFSGQMFLLNGKFSDRRTLVRYIIAYNGYVMLLVYLIAGTEADSVLSNVMHSPVCHLLPLTYLTDQSKLSFWKKMYVDGNLTLRTQSRLSCIFYGSLVYTWCWCSLNISQSLR